MISTRFGIKLWTINEESFRVCENLLEKGIFNYLELYVVPDEYNLDSLERFSKYEVILHAPSFNHKFNIVNKDKIFHSAIKSIIDVSNVVKSDYTIFHPGVQIKKSSENHLKYVISNLKEIDGLGLKVILENVPDLALDGSTKLIASLFEDFEYVIKETDTLVCVDIAHTIASANAFRIDPIVYLKKFLEIKPFIFHFCNSYYDTLTDVHLDIDKGNLPLNKIVKLIPENSLISLETPKKDMKNLTDDVRNLHLLKGFFKNSK